MAKKKEDFIGIWVAPDEKAKIETAARHEGRGVSGFGRFHLVKIAEAITGQNEATQSTLTGQAA